jgi:stage V sporulation protein S
MDRFFSKLDLRQIKIDPERSRFSPDEPDPEVEPEGATDLPVEAETVVEPEPMDVAGPGAEPDAAELRLDDVPSYQETTEVARNNDVLKVSSKSRPSAVAGAIAGVVRELGRAEVQAIGAGATNQAIKAVAIARDYLHETGIDAICLPEFIDITIDNEDRTAIRLVIEPR